MSVADREPVGQERERHASDRDNTTTDRVRATLEQGEGKTIVEVYRDRGYPPEPGPDVFGAGSADSQGEAVAQTEIHKLHAEQLSLASHMTPLERMESGVTADVLVALESPKLPAEYQLSEEELKRALHFTTTVIKRQRSRRNDSANAGRPGALTPASSRWCAQFSTNEP